MCSGGGARWPLCVVRPGGPVAMRGVEEAGPGVSATLLGVGRS